MVTDYISIELLPKALYTEPFIHPFTHKHTHSLTHDGSELSYKVPAHPQKTLVSLS